MRQKSLLLLSVFLICLFNVNSAWGVSKVISAPTPTVSVDYPLPYPGILPDHPLYFLKIVRDKILGFITKDPVKKIQLNLLFADKDLAMGQQLWEKGKTDLGTDTIAKGEALLLTAVKDLVKLKSSGSLPPGLLDKLQLAAKKHEEEIVKLISITSDETKREKLNGSLGIVHQASQQISSIK